MLFLVEIDESILGVMINSRIDSIILHLQQWQNEAEIIYILFSKINKLI